MKFAQKSKVIIVALVLLLALPIFALPSRADVGELKVEWQQFLPGISGNVVVQASNGGYLVLGTNATVQKIEEWVPRPGAEEKHIYTNYDQVLVKTDSQGNAIWAKTYDVDGSPITEPLEPSKMIQTSDGNYVIASIWVAENEPGKTSPASPPKVSLLKVDSEGNLMWSKLLQGYNPAHSDMSGFSVTSLIETSDQGFALTTGYPYQMYRWGIWFNKVDASGNFEWNRSLTTLDDTYISNMLQTGDGGYILAGWRGDHPRFYGPVVVLKVDSAGNFQWEKTFGGEGEYYHTRCSDAIATADGGYLLAGSTSPEGGPPHSWLIKTDTLGNMSWNRLVGPDDSGILSIAQVNSGGYVFVGSITTYRVWVGKTDDVGNLEAQAEIRTEDPYGNIAPSAVIEAMDGSYVFAGTWDNESDAGNRKMWLVKISSAEPKTQPNDEVSYNPILLVAVAVAAVIIVGVGFSIYIKKIKARKTS